MFQVLEKGGKLQPVHSKADLDYMTRNGWRVAMAVSPTSNEVKPLSEVCPAIDIAVERKARRKYTRRAR